MPNIRQPRSGSMQFWPRKRASRSYARVRAWADSKDPKILGFAGYKVGMTHVIATDSYKNSLSKGEEVSVPATVIECPPLKIAFVRFYKNSKVVTQVYAQNISKTLSRKLNLPKKSTTKFEDIKPELYNDIRVVVYTQPELTSIGKKKPEVFEVAIGGKLEDKLNYVKENLGKEIPISEIFNEGDIVDFHVVTKGKGYQGPVKRFGISLKQRKTEKGKRNPGARSGGWVAQGHMMFRVATAGQMGYFTRTEYNKLLLKIGNDPKEVNQKGGFMKYGDVKSQYLLVKGSVGGSKKRLVRFNVAIRPNHKVAARMPTIENISTTRK
ncbi:MAG: 50S ribosomal protein L3 [Minisyncoccales bacterium]